MLATAREKPREIDPVSFIRSHPAAVHWKWTGTEDGYAPGTGDQSCSPYASDHLPQDWQVGLSEVMEVVQFFNLNCYQPCPGAPGTYCPPN